MIKPQILPLLIDLYNLTECYNQYEFNYICADFHNFKEAEITKSYNNGTSYKIRQLVFGTGWKTELDDIYAPNDDMN